MTTWIPRESSTSSNGNSQKSERTASTTNTSSWKLGEASCSNFLTHDMKTPGLSRVVPGCPGGAKQVAKDRRPELSSLNFPLNFCGDVVGTWSVSGDSCRDQTGNLSLANRGGATSHSKHDASKQTVENLPGCCQCSCLRLWRDLRRRVRFNPCLRKRDQPCRSNWSLQKCCRLLHRGQSWQTKRSK